jgi:hypothetical protein
MAVKVNIVLDDDIKQELDSLVEAGMRSRVINIALRKELTAIRNFRFASVWRKVVGDSESEDLNLQGCRRIRMHARRTASRQPALHTCTL